MAIPGNTLTRTFWRLARPPTRCRMRPSAQSLVVSPKCVGNIRAPGLWHASTWVRIGERIQRLPSRDRSLGEQVLGAEDLQGAPAREPVGWERPRAWSVSGRTGTDLAGMAEAGVGMYPLPFSEDELSLHAGDSTAMLRGVGNRDR